MTLLLILIFYKRAPYLQWYLGYLTLTVTLTIALTLLALTVIITSNTNSAIRTWRQYKMRNGTEEQNEILQSCP